MWKNRTYPSMHIEHKVGDKMYVDFAGEKLAYVDEHTGEVLYSEVFVAILGWSQYTYVEAMRNQSAEEFIAACQHALHFFEGVPLALVPDNLKSAVIKANKYEPVLNVNFEAFAEHYGTSILPARARKPQDKSHVENMVKICYQKIYTNLPQKELSSLEELNKKIKAELEDLNSAKLTGKEYSRKDRWLLELTSLQPLCESTFEMREIKQVTVMKNGHVLLYEDKHYYSVPYQFIGKKLRLQYTRTQVEVYDQYKLIAKHKRIRSSNNYSTLEDHMSSTHRYITDWNPQFFLDKARLIDPVVENYIAQVLSKKTHPEQAYKSCQGILSFAGKVGKERLINACTRATDIGYFNYKTIDDILKKHMDKYNEENNTIQMPTHENIRGGGYYQ
jgi:transposase